MTDKPVYGARHPGLVLALLVLVYVIYAVDRSAPIIIAEEIKKEFGLSDSQLGMYTGMAYGLSYGVVGVLIGPVIDRVNRSRLLSIVLFVWSCLTGLGSIATSFWQLLVLRVFVGASEAGGGPTAMSILSDVYPPEKRGTALGLYKMGTPIGFLVASAGAGYLASHYGWRMALLIVGIPGVLLSLMLARWVPEPKRGGLDPVDEKAAASMPLPDVFRLIVSGPGIAGFLIGLSVYTCASLGLQAFIIPFLTRVHGLPLDVASYYYAIAAALGGIAPIVLGVINDRLSRKGPQGSAWLCVLVCAVTFVSGYLLLLAPQMWLSLGGMVIWQMMISSLAVPVFASMLTVVPPGARGSIIAVTLVGSVSSGTAIGPVLMGVLSDYLGSGTAVREAGLILLTLNLVSALSFFWATRALGRMKPVAGLQPATSVSASGLL